MIDITLFSLFTIILFLLYTKQNTLPQKWGKKVLFKNNIRFILNLFHMMLTFLAYHGNTSSPIYITFNFYYKLL